MPARQLGGISTAIVGYDDWDSSFMTHDPGTKHGKFYRYPQQTLFKAIHDFPGRGKDVHTGERVALAVQ